MPLHKIERKKKKRSTYWQENRLLIIPEVTKCPTKGVAKRDEHLLGHGRDAEGQLLQECRHTWRELPPM